MKHPFIQITYQRGKPFAAYLYLPRRDGDRSARVEQSEGDLLVDHAPDGRAIGIEITSPAGLDPEQLNRLLERLGHEPMTREDLGPLAVA
jgi:uncharacterized protein YuzE